MQNLTIPFLISILFIMSNCNSTKRDSQEEVATTQNCNASCQNIREELRILNIEQKNALESGDVDQAIGATIRIQLLQTAIANKETPTLDSIDSLHREIVSLIQDDGHSQPDCQSARACEQLYLETKLYKQLRLLHNKSPRLIQLSLNLEINSRIQEKNGANSQDLADKRRIIQNSFSDLNGLKHSRMFLDFSWPVCPAATQQWCDELGVELQKSRIDLITARNAGEEDLYPKKVKISEVRDSLELAYLGLGKDSPEFALIQKRYGRILESYSHSDQSDRALIYTEEEKAAVDKAMRNFGPLYIKETPSSNGVKKFIHAKAKQDMPWAGYWYPVRKNEIFAGSDAPLQKFDRVLERLGRSQGAVEWEANRYDPNDAHWAGLCDAWSIASLITKEPKRTVEMAGEQFTISDIKALSIKKYQQFAFDRSELGKSKIYGNRYYGNDESDGRLQDLRPEAFHRIATVLLRDRKLAFGIDDDSGPEVWNKPIFEMRWKIEKDPDIAQAYIVTASPTLTVNRFSISNQLTDLFSDSKAPRYRYRLYTDENDKNKDGARVISGEWIEKSRNIHPDTLFVVDPNQTVTPENPLIAANLDLIEELITKAQ